MDGSAAAWGLTCPCYGPCYEEAPSTWSHMLTKLLNMNVDAWSVQWYALSVQWYALSEAAPCPGCGPAHRQRGAR